MQPLSSPNLRIHYVGSTSIPGLKAKPIIDIDIDIDIDIAAKDSPPGGLIISRLELIGHTNKGEAGTASRFWFVKGVPRTFHFDWCSWNGCLTLV